ncbi:MFS transporter [Patulibacter sp.]|uniref:MFS transporter n=1 Tax=Patulibacter sp. TaxID=1912859 RepID=UPI00271E7536|nr:MFS transporter [Patulibacter sp.]MDO9408254.1 MFS transporter [Patulibacter sp.]
MIGRLPGGARWWGLGVLCASLLMVVMDMTILNVALPDMTADLRPGSTEVLWIVDVYSLVLAGLLVTASALGDRWGHKYVLVAGFVVFGAASAAVLVAESAGAVIAVRALLGVGGAMIMPATLSMIRHLFPDGRERAFALGIWGAMAGVGAALGPILGGLMVELFDWHAAFLVNVPAMVLAAIAAVLLLPRGRSSSPAPWDVPALVLSVVGMVALVFAIKDLAKHGVEPAGVVSAVVAAVGLTLFVRRCLGRDRPILELRLLARRQVAAGVLTALATMIALSAVLLVGAQWLQAVEGHGPLMAGVALLPAAVGGIVFAPLAPSIAERVGARVVLATGLAAPGLGFLALALAGDPTYPVFAFTLVMIGVGTGALAFGSAVIMAGTPTDRAGSAAAIEETSYEIGTTLGVAVLGSLAAVIYRDALPVGDLGGLPADGVAAARESIGGAQAVASGLDPAAAADLLARAQTALSDALSGMGVAGAIVLLLSAGAVFLLTPRRVDLSEVDGH